MAERSRLEIFMYSCNGREYLLLYEAFMLNIDYLFSERIFLLQEIDQSNIIVLINRMTALHI